MIKSTTFNNWITLKDKNGNPIEVNTKIDNYKKPYGKKGKR